MKKLPPNWRGQDGHLKPRVVRVRPGGMGPQLVTIRADKPFAYRPTFINFMAAPRTRMGLRR